MTALGLIPAGARVTAAMLRSVAPLAAYKASNQPVTSSTTLVNDSNLFVPVAANSIYKVDLFISYVGFTQGSSDLKMMFTGPSGSVMTWEPKYLNTSGALVAGVSNLLGAVVQAGTNGAGNNRVLSGDGTFSVGSTAGNLQVQWAQNTSSTTATQVMAGSLLTLWQVE